MNCGNSAIAWSGVAASSKTARAAAQHRSNVSVNSMAAARMDSGMPLRTVIAVSNGFSAFIFTSSPFSGVGGGEKLPLSACRGLTCFTRRHSGRHHCSPTQVSLAVHGKVHSFGGAGAAGAFLVKHARSVCTARLTVHNHYRSPLL
jgi:hypothetical protein